MADLSEPAGLSGEDRRRWMRAMGEQLQAETERPAGVTAQQEGPDGQPVWGIWWDDAVTRHTGERDGGG